MDKVFVGILNGMRKAAGLKEIKEQMIECPHGGDNTDCGSCVYGADYEWSDAEEDCVRKEAQDNE